MRNWNKRKVILASVILVVVILVSLCVADSVSESVFQRIVELHVSSIRLDMKCESRDIGSVEHIACWGNDNRAGIFVLYADYPNPAAELTSYYVHEGNTVGFLSCYSRAKSLSSLIEDCPTSELIHISEAVNRMDRVQTAWNSGQLSLDSN